MTSVLRDYALLGDGERGALVGPDGDVSWMCFPRWDSPAVFAGLIGGGGCYQVVPHGRWVWGGHYDHGLVWTNRWTTEHGHVECRDTMTLPGRSEQAWLLRSVTAIAGPARLSVRLALRADFGAVGCRENTLHDDGCWRGRLGDGSYCWVGGQQARLVRDGRHQALELDLRLEPGQVHHLVLGLSTDAAPLVAPASAEELWADTEQGWRRRLPAQHQHAEPVAARDVRHAHAILSGLTSHAGATVAAATLGLPERAEAGRNYDYRYAWVRDQCFIGHAGAVGDDPDLLTGSVGFVTRLVLEHGPNLAPAYRTDGRPVPDEVRLDLPGYPGGAPVVGNWVNGQFQLDEFGYVLSLLAAAGERDALDADGWRAVVTAVEAIQARHAEPDAGIWELPPALWAQSRLQCAAGLRAVSRLPHAGGQGASWAALADQLISEAGAVSLHPTGRWQRAPDDPRIDAALLLPALRGALPADDPRTRATLQAVREELVQDGYCYRFRHGDRPLADAEGAFLLCGFLLSLSLLDQGDVTAATGWFERTRAACGPPGLLTEEFDVVQRQLRGNVPQAFVHALLIETAARLEQAHSR